MMTEANRFQGDNLAVNSAGSGAGYRLANVSCRLAVVVAVMAVFSGGCASYKSMPLTRKTVNAQLTWPNDKTIQLQAGKIKHPHLNPVKINLSDGVSADEAAVLAVLLNPTLRVERDRRKLANAQLFAAGLLPNPSFSYGVVLATNDKHAKTGFDLGLDWEVTSLITRNEKIKQAKSQQKQVNLEIAWQEWQVAMAARQAVYDLTALEMQSSLAKNMYDRLGDNLKLTTNAVKQGQMTELDMAAARSAYNDAYGRLLQMQHDVEKQRLQLKRLLGMDPANKLKLQTGAVLPDKPDKSVGLYRQWITTDKWTKGIQDRRLDLLALREGYNSQEAAVRLAVLEQFPRISFGTSFASDDANLHTLGFGIAVDLPIFDRNRGKIALERATRKQLFDEYANRVFQARCDIAELLKHIETVGKMLANAEKSVPDLQKLVRTYRRAVQQGQADVLSYYTAWNSLTQKQIEVLALKRELADLHIALQLTSGLYNE